MFSVVIPTYNRVGKLKTTIDSVLSQSFRNFELLVMDDGSTDETEKLVSNIEDPRIRYDWQVNSGGPATPRNRGIDLAVGTWICFLDADDVWFSNKLEEVENCIKADQCLDVICHNEIMKNLVNGESRDLRHGPYEKEFYRAMLIYGNRLSTSAVTVRREFLNIHNLRFNTSDDFTIVEDYDLWLRLAFNNARFHFIDQSLGEYVIEDDNLTNSISRHRKNSENVLREHIFNIQKFENNKNALWKKVRMRLQMAAVKDAINAGKLFKAISQFVQALLGSPLDFPPYVAAWLRRKRFSSS